MNKWGIEMDCEFFELRQIENFVHVDRTQRAQLGTIIKGRDCKRVLKER